jgi:hypothetical protein
MTLQTDLRHAGLLVLLVCLYPIAAIAEPYIAVREGLACGACHVNPTGGGLRNAYGNAYAQTQLSLAGPSDALAGWTGRVAPPLAVGADARYTASQVEQDDTDTAFEFATRRVSAYIAADIGERVTLYVDQLVAPGGSLNREAWVQYRSDRFYVKAGRMFLPFGWRLEDNTSLVRQVSSVNMLQGDDGVEAGWQANAWTGQLAVTNGAGGGAERDDGKQISARFAVGQGSWRLGLSGIDNRTDIADRQAFGVFGGLRTGPLAWLFEYDVITDDLSGSVELEQKVALLEANWEPAQGHNLKITVEQLEFDESEDQRRFGFVYELTPLPFVQLRVGARKRDSDAANPFFDSSEAFLEVHGFF